MAHVIDTPAGKMETSNPWFDRNIVSEVIHQDCYRLRRIAKHFTPEILFDVGMGRGQVSMLARKVWPNIRVTGFEISREAAEEAWRNVPGSMVHTAQVGWTLRSVELVTRFGFCDLLVIDCEGGECPFFHDLFVADYLKNFKVICGEWHWETTAALLAAAMAKDFSFRIAQPEVGARWGYFFAVNKTVPAHAALCTELDIQLS